MEELIQAAIIWASKKEAFVDAEQSRHEIGEANTKSKGGQTVEYGIAYRISGEAAKGLFEAEVHLLDAVKAYQQCGDQRAESNWDLVCKLPAGHQPPHSYTRT